MSKKVQVVFDDAALVVLQRLKKASGAASISEVLTAAIGLYDWAHDQTESGYAVGAFKPGAKVKEVVLFQPKPAVK